MDKQTTHHAHANKAAQFKLGMRQLASGLAVITAQHAGEPFGLLSTSVSSVSLDPPTLLVCVNRAASSHDPIVASGHFCVNILGEEESALAASFSSSARRHERFEGRSWRTLRTGAPALEGCISSFDCTVVESVPFGTHTIFIGSVEEVKLWGVPPNPLIYHNGAYKRLHS